jgi:UDP-N-acetyl-D-mannosaminuronic acid transferase (WecB/TagA/CpsF family)
MGMPRQEAWINENWKQILARTIFCSGCTMDYIAGIIPSCPRWLGNSGFEWLYRLGAEPGRLWKRYLVEPWFVLGHLLSGRFSRSRMSDSPRGELHRECRALESSCISEKIPTRDSPKV